MPVPIDIEEMVSMVQIIQHVLNDDEAGPGFFIANDKWVDDNNLKEVPF